MQNTYPHSWALSMNIPSNNPCHVNTVNYWWALTTSCISQNVLSLLVAAPKTAAR